MICILRLVISKSWIVRGLNGVSFECRVISFWSNCLIVVWVSEPMVQVRGLLRYQLRIAIGLDGHICTIWREYSSFTVITMYGASINQSWFARLVRHVETSAQREGWSGKLHNRWRCRHKRLETCRLLYKVLSFDFYLRNAFYLTNH